MKRIPATEDQKKYYNSFWSKNTSIGLHAKCRKEFIIANLARLPTSNNNPKIIDMGCGRGWLTAELAKYGNAVGVDLSDIGIKMAKINYPQCHFKQMDIMTGEIKDKYDVVVSSEVIEHLTEDNQKKYVRKIRDILVNNGYLILTTPNVAIAEKLVEYNLVKQEDLQPIENWLGNKEMCQLMNQYFEIKHIGSTMFMPLFIQKYRLLELGYRLFYHRLGLYKIINKLLKSSNNGLYLTVVAQKVI